MGRLPSGETATTGNLKGPEPARRLRDRAARTAGHTVLSGADVLAAKDFSVFTGQRVGLITNQTGLVGTSHLADLLHAAQGVRLTAILAPEHGFRGGIEAGAKVGDSRDERTGIPVHSLYGATRKPTRRMLRDIDILVFDIQDIGARFYTYISTMGLAMQAAAERRIPFVVLDRPNPLGGDYVSGFVREPALSSFVGQYPIPIVHGLTVGELAQMIKGEGYLDGLERLDLSVIRTTGWTRTMRWPSTGRRWVATSPNIPTFACALLYPGIGIVGETAINEGRGTPQPFTQFGAPWIDKQRLASSLNASGLKGIAITPVAYVPRAIPNVASDPRFEGQRIDGVRVDVTDVSKVTALELGMHALAGVAAEARRNGVSRLFPNLAMFHAIAGTRRLHRMVGKGADGHTIVASWQKELAAFNATRARYLIY